MTTKGFISAVSWRGCKRTLCVRARTADHLAALFPGRNVIVCQDADYRYRCRVERKYFEGVVAAEIRLITYTNFKAQIRDHHYHDACMDVWRAMHRLQEPARQVFNDDVQPDMWNAGLFVKGDPGDDPDEEIPWI